MENILREIEEIDINNDEELISLTETIAEQGFESAGDYEGGEDDQFTAMLENYIVRISQGKIEIWEGHRAFSRTEYMDVADSEEPSHRFGV